MSRECQKKHKKCQKSVKNSKNKNAKIPKYYCAPCDYYALQKCHFDKHLLSKKHKKKTYSGIAKMSKKCNTFFCEFCNKNYSTRQGLWYHRNKNPECNIKNKNMVSVDETQSNIEFNETENINSGDLMNVFMEFMKSQQKTNMAVAELAKKTTTTYNNCGNKNLTVNVYLNEHCKDAMNLKDFVQNLHVSIEDLMYTKEHGYVKGVSNLLTKQLNILNPSERPIHCSDSKRLQFYVKDENKWEKDENHKKLDQTIHDIKIKQIKELGEWEKKNPNYMKNEKLLQEWQKLVHEIMGETNDDIKEKKQTKEIKKHLGEECNIKKAMEKGLQIE